MPFQVQRALVVHPDEGTRRSIEQVLRRVDEAALSVHHSESPSESFEAARRLDPRFVFLDLSEERQLALEVARGMRAAGRLIVGLYNPLVLRHGEVDFFRQAARAGVGDFVPVPVAEAELRAVLAAAAGEQETERAAEGRVVTFISPKGGVGTTTLAVNTALVLSASGLVGGDVVLCDGAVQFGDAVAHLGLAAEQDMADLLRDLDGLQTLSPYLIHHPQSHLRLLASPRDPLDGDRISPEELGRVLIALRRRFAMVVVDTPPVLDLLTLAALDLSERVFVVTEAVAPSVLSTRRFLKLLERQGFGDRVRVVLNRLVSGEGNLPENLVAEQLDRAIDHVVPHDPAVLGAVNRGVPEVLADQDGAFAEAVGGIAEAAVAPDPVAETVVHS